MLCCRWKGTSEQLCSAERLWAHVSLHQCAQELAQLIDLSSLSCVVNAHTSFSLSHVCTAADGRGPMNSSAVLSVCGLMSACISVHKNWPGAQELPLAKFPGSAFNV